MIKICFHADNDVNADAQAVNAAMVGENADLYCFVGDGPYSTKGTGWVAQQKKHFDDKKDKMVWSRGNHDTKSSESMQTQRDMEAWFPEAKKLGIDDTWLYSKQVGNVYVISMDTEDMDVEFERDQFNFVKAELAKAKQLRQSGQIDWIVVLFHKPFFTLKSSHSPYTAVRFMYKDLFRDAQVDFAVSGHNHNTQLWKPMIPNQSQANGEGEQLFKFASDGKTFDFAQDHGALYIVTGHSAHEWNAINDSGSGVKNVMHYRDSGDFGYTLIEFDGKKSKVLSKDTTGKVHFEYNVTRDGGIITNPPPDNKPPIANAGPDKIVAKKSNVMLNGSQSTDPDGTILKSYKWTQVNGPNVVLNNSNSAIASFTSPDEDNKAMTFQLEVTDDKGAKATDTVTITTSSSPPPTEIVCPYKYHYEEDLKKCVPDLEPDFEPICPPNYKWNGIVCKWIGGGGEPPENKPPVADAGNDEIVKPKSNVMLNGSKSYDPEGTVLTIFEWKQLSGPADVTLSNTSTINPTFAAPDKEGQYIFQLTVADDRGLKDTDTVMITVKKDAPTTDPVAKLVAPSQVQGGQNVVLDGSQSIADTLTITQTAGQNVSLTDAGTFKKKFTAPTGGNFQLAFQAVAVKGTKQAITQIAIQVSTQTQPPPANLIWSMFNNLVTGQDFTVNDKYGPQGAGEGGIYTAASGGPFVEVKKDGTVWLCSKSGGHPRFYIKVCNYNFKETGWKMFPDSKPDDINTKGRNRHQMGGACENRQGGLGFVHQLPNLIKSKLEICHNTHTLNKEGKTSKNFEFGKWYYYENYLCDVAGGGTRRIAKIDMNGKSELPKRDEVGTNLETVIDEVIKLPDAFYKKEMFEKESEFWHRMNPASAAKAGLFDNKIYKIEESDLPPPRQ